MISGVVTRQKKEGSHVHAALWERALGAGHGDFRSSTTNHLPQCEARRFFEVLSSAVHVIIYVLER
jgi:uncharacterized protein YfaA (DUF2138 family)